LFSSEKKLATVDCFTGLFNWANAVLTYHSGNCPSFYGKDSQRLYHILAATLESPIWLTKNRRLQIVANQISFVPINAKLP